MISKISIVNKDKLYHIHYSIKNRKGDILEATEKNTPLSFYQGDGSVLKVIENAVVTAGDTTKFELTVLPKDAFGVYDASLIFKVKRRAFKSSEPLILNQSIYANTPHGKRLVTVTNITESTVTVNGNHELAGKTLFIDIKIINS